jgi:hypothetical protein
MFHAKLILIGLLIATFVQAQTQPKSTSSYFDDSEMRNLAPKYIQIQGEMQNPGTVDLSGLPIRSVALKEMAIENGKQVFKGAFFVNGYSLYDILNTGNYKKSPGNTFSPAVDLYIVVENGEGERAAFSWGEIFYRNSFDILIAKTIQPIYPARTKASYLMPDAPRLVCAGDLFNARYINNPTKIIVKSRLGPMPKDKPENIYSPEVKVVAKAGGFAISEIGASIEKRNYSSVSYGHGMGFKGNEDIAGYLLKDLLAANLKPTPEMLREWLIVASAKDGYRVVYSLSEIMNRSDNQEFILVDQKDDPARGRYLIYPPDDFFVDRDVKAVEKLELFSPE